ncbi:MAG: hypothetical protein KUG74_15145 [Rhodobacteraceae bacterium]|nr:hypothetical protein [Paracoccaceae bacterium]
MTNFFTKSAVAFVMLGLATSVSAKGYKEIEVSDGGSLVGTVSAGGAESESRSYNISKDPEICGEGTREVPFVEISETGMLMNAVVFLNKVKEGKAFNKDEVDLTLTQEKCEFAPALGVMANKGKLTAINSDHTLHNIHTYEQIGKARRTVMNVSQPNAGDTVTKAVKLRKGNGMKVECDAHDFMHSFVYVAKNPYYSVVNAEGGFSIDGIPAGTYEVKMWHGFLGEVEVGDVTISAGGESSMELSY